MKLNLPPEDHFKWGPVEIPVVNGKTRIGIVNDIHLPYQDTKALTIALDYLYERKITVLYLNGDIMDIHKLSKFVVDPSKKNFIEELKITRQFLNDLKQNFKGVKMYFKEGNHEHRYEAFLMQKAPELMDEEFGSLASRLKLKELGITHIASKNIARAGKLNIIHGHEIGKGVSTPVNAARTFHLKTLTNVIGGHLHQASSHPAQDLNGNQIGSWSIGCLCDLHPEYNPVNKWQHGFADVTFYEDGFFNVNNYKIIKGRVVNA